MQHLASRRVAAILCGLRLLQQRLQAESPKIKLLNAEQRAILTGDGALKPLALDEIDALCQQLNLGHTITFSTKELDRLIIELDFAADEADIELEEIDTEAERRGLRKHCKLARHLARQFLRITNAQQGAAK